MSDLYIGLMSGTSLDGIDGVLANFSQARPRVLAHAHHDFTEELRAELLALNAPIQDELHRAQIAGQHLARGYAAVVDDLLRHAEVAAGEVRAIGAHGQTVRHRPDEGYTLQLNAPAVVAELTGIDVVADFRSRDVAAGGQGAPLVPALHEALFAGDGPRVVVNIGGVSNLTALPAHGSGTVHGFDCGPGNVLLDTWIQEKLGRRYDDDGTWAAGGRVDETLLAALLAEPYFTQAPPKSTGRELFNRAWLQARLAGRSHAPRDVQATLTRLTAEAIGRAIAAHAPESKEVLVCGGGARNGALMRMLAAACAPRTVHSTAAFGVPPDQVEALAFAWLACAHVRRLPGNVPAVTGALGPRVLGALYPA
jgi:anhydro-N-acetylmuramic acid kinase